MPRTEQGQDVHAHVLLEDSANMLCHHCGRHSVRPSPHRGGVVTLQNRILALREETDIPAVEAVWFNLSGTDSELGSPPCRVGSCDQWVAPVGHCEVVANAVFYRQGR